MEDVIPSVLVELVCTAFCLLYFDERFRNFLFVLDFSSIVFMKIELTQLLVKSNMGANETTNDKHKSVQRFIWC